MNVRVTKRKRKTGTAIMLDFHDLEGRRHQRIVGKASDPDALKLVEEEANRQAKRIEYELVEGKYRPSIGTEPIDSAFVEFWEHLDCSNVRDGTKEIYKNVMRLFREFLKGTGAKSLADVTPDLIRKYVKFRKGMAANTIARDLRALHRIFGRCVTREMILTNPLDHPDVKDIWPAQVRHERVFTDEELDLLLDTVRREDADHADLLRMLSETGLRISEALMLRWCDIHFGEDSYLRVQEHDGWQPKTKRSTRNIPLTQWVGEMLKERLGALERISPTSRIFPVHWTRQSVGDALRKARKVIGLDDPDERGQRLVMHSLRHYYATTLVRSGADPASVRDLLGHDSITTTNRYFNTPRQELFNAVRGVFTRHRNVTDSTRHYTFPQEIAAPASK